MDDLDEAKQILTALQGISERLRTGDRKFLESWLLHLERRGASVRVGRFRLYRLRQVAASYGLIELTAEQATAPELPEIYLMGV